MKETGIIRRIDDLGRIVIPREVRRIVRVKEGDPLEIFLVEEGIFLKRHDSTKTIMDTVAELKEIVDCSAELDCRSAMLKKIKELEELAKDEQAKSQGRYEP